MVVQILIEADYAMHGASQVVLLVKNLRASGGDTRDSGLIPGSGRSLGRGNGNPLQYSYWKVPWTEEPGGQQSMEPQRGTTEWLSIHTHTHTHTHLAHWEHLISISSHGLFLLLHCPFSTFSVGYPLEVCLWWSSPWKISTSTIT